jgi:hypothetical protein
MFKSLPFLIVLLVIPSFAQSTAPAIASVEVLEVGAGNESMYVSTRKRPDGTTVTCLTSGSPLSTDCAPTLPSMTAPEIDFPYLKVDLVLGMPDGTKVKASCSWSLRCRRPLLGTYQARIHRNTIELRLPEIEGKPEYSPDGTFKKAAKVKEVWGKFSFEGK